MATERLKKPSKKAVKISGALLLSDCLTIGFMRYGIIIIEVNKCIMKLYNTNLKSTHGMLNGVNAPKKVSLISKGRPYQS